MNEEPTSKKEDEIFCKECGKIIKRNTVICPYCGQVVNYGPEEKETSKDFFWEYCQIERGETEDITGFGLHLSNFLFNNVNSRAIFKYQAEAIGKEGKYIAGYSPECIVGYYGADKELERVHNELVKQLVKDGWIPISERGPYNQLRFKRKVSI
jgi:hypothetical protein